MSPKKPQPGTIASNRRARYDYHVDETFETGISLVGSEVKSLRGGKATLSEAYALVRAGEVFLHNMHIPHYAQAATLNHEPARTRKLLLNRAEIRRIEGKLKEKGLALVPLRLYFKGNKVKVELAVARGKKAWDKRQTIAKREAEREMRARAGRTRERR